MGRLSQKALQPNPREATSGPSHGTRGLYLCQPPAVLCMATWRFFRLEFQMQNLKKGDTTYTWCMPVEHIHLFYPFVYTDTQMYVHMHVHVHANRHIIHVHAPVSLIPVHAYMYIHTNIYADIRILTCTDILHVNTHMLIYIYAYVHVDIDVFMYA